jgi:estrogen-related receptor beta like 1
VQVRKELAELESRAGGNNEKMATLTAQLSELSERLDDLKETLESKDSGINDTSPMVRIKAALQQIKSEIHAFDLRIGVVSHSLLSARVSSTSRRRDGAAQNARRRMKKNRRKGEVAGNSSDEASLDEY